MSGFLGAPVEKFSIRHGSVYIWRPVRGMFVTRIKGVLTEDGANIFDAAVRRQLSEEGRHVGFHDWDEMTDYESGARMRLTTTAVAHLHAIEGAHFLLSSRVVRFGVQAANVVLRKITTYSSRELFERALEDTYRRAGGVRRASVS